MRAFPTVGSRAMRIVVAVALVALTLGGARPAAAAGELLVTTEVLRGTTPATAVLRNEPVTIRVTVKNTLAAPVTLTSVTATATGLDGSTVLTPAPATLTASGTSGDTAVFTTSGVRGSLLAAASSVSVTATATGTVPDDTLAPADADTDPDAVNGTSPAATATLSDFAVATQLLRSGAPAAGFLVGEAVTVRAVVTSFLPRAITVPAGEVDLTTTNLGGSGTNAATTVPAAPAGGGPSVFNIDIPGFTAGPGSPATASATVSGTVPDNTLQPSDGANDPEGVTAASPAPASATVGGFTVTTHLARPGSPGTSVTSFFPGEPVTVRTTIVTNLPQPLTIAAGGVALTTSNLGGSPAPSPATTVPAGSRTTTIDVTGYTAGPGSPATASATVTGTVPDNTFAADVDTAPDTLSASTTSPASAAVLTPVFTFTGAPAPAAGPVARGSTVTVTASITNPAPPGGPSIIGGTFLITAPAGTTIGTATATLAVPPPVATTNPVLNTVTVAYATIAPGETKVVTVPTTVRPNATTTDPGPDLTFEATFTSVVSLPDPLPGLTLGYEIRADADLTLAISPPSQSVQKNKPTDLVVTVGNLGPEAATGTKTVTVTLTGTGEITAATGTGCTVTSPTLATCVLTAPIAPGGTVSLPLRVRGATPGTATLTAHLTTTGTEFDVNATNNADAVATVAIQQSSTDLTIAAATPVELILNAPPQTVTYTLTVVDPDTSPNGNDPAEGVVVTIPIPTGLTATNATFAGATSGTCNGLPAPAGNTVTCTIGTIADGASVTVSLSLQATALTVGTPVTATATATNQDPTIPNTASVLVTVLLQPVDLAVNDNPNVVLSAATPGGTTVGGNFVVTVTNNSAASFTSGAYVVTIDLPAATSASVVLSEAEADCTTDVAQNVVTCTGTGLGSGPRSFVIHADSTVRGPITVRSNVALAPTNTTQVDPEEGNDTDTWTITRAEADLTLAVNPASQDIQKRKTATVDVLVHNNGPDAATGIKTVTVTLNGVGRITDATGPGCTVNSNTLATCVLADPIASGGTVTLPIKVRSNDVGTATLTASLSTTGLEVDTDTSNDVDVPAIINFGQSSSDLSIASSPTPLELIFQGPAQPVAFTLTVDDRDDQPNHDDPAEGVVVTMVIPAGVRATGATFPGAPSDACSASAGFPAVAGDTVTCKVGEIAEGATVTVTLTVEGTSLVTEAAIVATATSANNDPTTPNTATALVTVKKQPVDLSVSDGETERVFTTIGPLVTTRTEDFTVTVTNNTAAVNGFAAGSYTLTIESLTTATPPAAAAAGAVTFASPGCTATATGLTCPGTNLDGNPDTFVISTTITALGPFVIRSTVTLNGETQEDLVPGNNSDSWTITRNIPPNDNPDVAPVVPAGSTLVYDVMANNTDPDGATETAALTIEGPFTGAGEGTTAGRDDSCGRAPARCTRLKVDVAATAPAAVFSLTYNIVDPRGAKTPTTLMMKVVPAVTARVEGNFFNPPPAGTADAPGAINFGAEIDRSVLDRQVRTIDVLAGELGKQADGNPFPAGTTHSLTTVTGSKVPETGLTTPEVAAKKVVGYDPAPGYTSHDELENLPPAPALPGRSTPPVDRFSYTTTGATATNPALFTLASGVDVEVTNQNPIGIDTLVEVPNGVTQTVTPADDAIDGNRQATITVDGTPYVFNDDGKQPADPARRLKISCIGVLNPDELGPDGRPAVLPIDKCPSPTTLQAGWQGAGGAGLELKPLNPDGTVNPNAGKVTVKLQADSRSLTYTADATVVGEAPFHFVVTDIRGGASFAKAIVRVPNTPPQVIEGVRTVLKNTPTIVVDTKLATADNNGDVITVLGTTAKTEHGRSEKSADGSKITYTPDKDYLGPDSLIYNVSDGRGGSASGTLQLNVIDQPAVVPEGSGTPTATGGGAAGGSPAGSLASTGGDPLPLTAAAGTALVLGLLLVQAGRRRQSLPLLERARHLRT